MVYNTAEICSILQGTLHGNGEISITRLASLEQAQAGDLSFIQDDKKLKSLTACTASALLVTAKMVDTIRAKFAVTLIVVANPMQSFLQLLQRYQPLRTSSHRGISPHAAISEKAKIGTNCIISPHAVIEDDVEIGSYCYIGAGVSIGAGTKIGEGTTLYARVVIYPGMEIGNHVIIHAGAVIGADGFGYQFQGGSFHKLPHHGRVKIEDHVEIGANTTIDRAMIHETKIGHGTKIDNLVMVAHNCEIGQHTVIASQVGIAGSTTIGSYCQFGGQAGIADHLHIGNQCSIAAMAGVMRDIPDGEAQIGAPSGPLNEQRKIVMIVQKLPELRDKIRTMEKTIVAMQETIQQIQTPPHLNDQDSQTKAA
jgi:UDP-3-O-[3-hydroxymyristoyl] glucosamine N-acyltransferase